MLKSVILLALASVATARKCMDITVPVRLSSRNAVFGIDLPKTEVDVTNFFLEFSKQGQNYTDVVLEGVSLCRACNTPGLRD